MTLSGNARGAAWILLACVAASLAAIAVRALASHVHASEIGFVRCLVGLILFLPTLGRGPRFGFRSRHWKLHLVRGVLGAVTVVLGFYVLTVLPLATATVIFFTAPLFVTLLAPPLLGETVGWRRWLATAAGFGGTLVVLEPSPGGFEPAMPIAVLSSFVFALVLVTGKRLSRTESPSTLMLYFGAVTSVFTWPPAALVWTWPSPSELVLLLAVGVFSTLRNYAEVRAYAAGEASLVSPIQYVRILMVAAAGYWLFDEVPGWNTAIGAAIVVASTFYIARVEATRDSKRAGIGVTGA